MKLGTGSESISEAAVLDGVQGFGEKGIDGLAETKRR